MYSFGSITCENHEKARHSAAWKLLLALIKQECGYCLTENDFVRNENGKPFCPEYPHLYTGIAHTKGVAVAVVSDEPIGIDCEYIHPVSVRVRNRMLGGFDGTDRDAVILWTKLESRVKLEGTTIWKLGFSYTDPESGGYSFTGERVAADGSLIVTVCRKKQNRDPLSD